MTIRRGVEGDSPMLTRLAREAKASWGYPREWLDEWAPDLSLPPAYIRDNAVFVAEVDGRVVGVIGLDDGEDGPQIGHLWISPEAQGQGWGRRLVDAGAEYARQRRWPSLRILSDPYAQPFYERLGAVHIGDEPAPVAGTARTLPVLSLAIDLG